MLYEQTVEDYFCASRILAQFDGASSGVSPPQYKSSASMVVTPSRTHVDTGFYIPNCTIVHGDSQIENVIVSIVYAPEFLMNLFSEDMVRVD